MAQDQSARNGRLFAASLFGMPENFLLGAQPGSAHRPQNGQKNVPQRRCSVLVM
jgi:hypothetical protein